MFGELRKSLGGEPVVHVSHVSHHGDPGQSCGKTRLTGDGKTCSSSASEALFYPLLKEIRYAMSFVDRWHLACNQWLAVNTKTILSVLTVIIALLLIPNMINYINIFILNIGNWCGTPETTSWGLLWAHWVVLFMLYRSNFRGKTADGNMETTEQTLQRIEALAEKIGRLMLIAGGTVLVGPRFIESIARWILSY